MSTLIVALSLFANGRFMLAAVLIVPHLWMGA
jgi:hypothetical protein